MSEAPPPRKRRWPRRVLLALVGLVLLFVVGVGSLLLYLQTSAGGERVRRIALDAANGALEGRFDAQQVELHGLSVVVRGATLRTPEGELVGRIDEVRASVRLWPLLRKRVEIPNAEIIGPDAHLVNDERGLNVLRAVRPRNHGPSEPGGPNPWAVEIDSVTLRGGKARMDQPGKLPEELALDGLGVDGLFSLAPGEHVPITIRANAKGELTAPTRGPLTIHFEMDGQEGSRHLSTQAKVAGLDLEAHIELGEERLDLTVDELSLAPETARALLPWYPLAVPLGAKGALHRRGNVDSIQLHATAGKAKAELGGAFDFARLHAEGLTLSANDVDLHELTGKGPTTALSLRAHASGGGTSIANAEGEGELEIPVSTVNGRTVGPVAIKAHAAHGTVSLDSGTVKLPGLSVAAQGTASEQHLDLGGSLEARDLAELARTFEGLGGTALPSLAGTGRLRFHLTGPARHPALEADGQFAHLHVAANHLDAMTLSAQVPDLTRPLEANASLHIGNAEVSGRTLKNVAVELTTHGRSLRADVSMQGLAELVLHVEGLLDPDAQGLAVNVLTLRYPEASWALTAPTHVRFAGTTVTVSPLSLASGTQTISLELDKEGPRIEAHLDAQGVELARLPRFVTESYGLAGMLSLQLEAKGRLPRPEGTVHLTLRDGAVRGLHGLAADIDATYRRDRARGTAKISGLEAQLSGQFDVPLAALFAHRGEKLSAQFDLPEFELASTLCAAAPLASPETLCPKGKALAQGRLRATVTLAGTTERPELDSSFVARGLVIRNAPPADLTLVLRSEGDRDVAGSLTFSALGGHGALEARVMKSLGALLAHPPRGAEVRVLPVRLDAELEDLALAPLHQSGLLPSDLGGTVGLSARLSGTVGAPIGNLVVNGHALTLDGSLPVEAGAAADLEREQAKLRLRAAQGATPLANLSLLIDRSADALADASVREQAPFHLTGSLGPVDLGAYPLFTGKEKRKGQKLHGVIAGKLDGSGRLISPVLALEASFNQFGVGRHSLGHMDLTLRYQDAKAVLDTVISTPSKGQLEAHASGSIDLSLPAIRQGLALADMPFTATVRAQQFDLDFLSGLSPTARRLGGTLDADASFSGKLAAPALQGSLEWKNGTVTLTGFGQYEAIHLALQGTRDQVNLSDLSVKSGGGSLKASLLANRSGDHFVLKGSATSNQFPVVTEDQLLATATLRSTFTGEATASVVNVSKLDIPEAHIELPQVRRRDLQPLARPDDIVLLREGQPENKDQRSDPRILADLSTATQKQAPRAAPPEAPPARRFYVTFNAPRNLWVKSAEDVNAEIGLSNGFRVEYADKTSIYGEIRVIRARVEALGRRFDVRNDSQLRFTGPADKPYISATAVYKNENADVTVFLNVRGQGSDITLKVSSEPSLPESEIYTLLATGRIDLKRGSGSSAMSGGQAASIVGAYVAGQFKDALLSKVPLDVVTVEAGSEGLSGSKIEAGTYITDKVYVGYTGRIGADPTKGENSNAVRLEYQITPRISIQGEYGDARSGGIDLLWTKDY